MKNPIIIIDNGHGAETPGKRSPDGAHREWSWCRSMARRIAGSLRGKGADVRLLVTEDFDVPLGERCRRANAIALEGESLLLSIHNNAAGAGDRWLSASGFSAFVAPGASDRACRLAALLTREAASRGLMGNRCTPPEGYWTAPLTICRRTVCPAVLTENMFQDNLDDVSLLLSAHGQAMIEELHVAAVLKFSKEL